MTTLIGDFRKPIDPKALAPKGLSGALRYWTKQHGSTLVVGLTAAEIGRYDAVSVPLGTIYEDTAAGWMSGGAAAGKQAATYLLAQFRTVGWTPTSLYFADDADTISSAATNACLDAAAQVFGFAPDLYAFDTELESAHSGGHSRRSWLTGHFPGSTVAAVQKAMPWLYLYQCQGSQPAGIPTTVTVSGVVGDVDIALRKDWNDDMTAPTPAQIWGYENEGAADAGDMHKYLTSIIPAQIAALGKQVTGAITKQEADLLAALAGVDAGTKTAIAAAVTQIAAGGDVTALAAALAPLLAATQASPEEVGAAVVAALRAQFNEGA